MKEGLKGKQAWGITTLTPHRRDNTPGPRMAKIPFKCINRCVTYARDEVMPGAVWFHIWAPLGQGRGETSVLCPPRTLPGTGSHGGGEEVSGEAR